MNLANRITILRILIVPVFISSLIYYNRSSSLLRHMPLVIFAVACLTDAIDGGIARSRDQTTRLGIVLDPIADKLLIASAFISLAVLKNIPAGMRMPPWTTLIVVTRDIIIILGAVIIYFLKGDIVIRPSPLSKVTTFFQMSAVIATLLFVKAHRLFIYPAAFLTLLSGLDYIWRGSRQLNDN